MAEIMVRSVERVRGAGRDERGSTLIEFAILAMVFLLITFGAMEYGRMIFDYNVVAHAVREGARFAAVRGASAGPSEASATDIKNYVANHSFGLLVPENVTVSWLPDGANTPGHRVQVAAATTFSSDVRILPVLSTNLHSQTEMGIAR